MSDMETGVLLLYIVIATICATAIWLLVRWLCLILSGSLRAEGDEGKSERVYFGVLTLRLAGFVLCLAALAAWLHTFSWLFCLVLAGLGCVLQYIAYRKRMHYAMGLSRQRQTEVEQTLLSGTSANV